MVPTSQGHCEECVIQITCSAPNLQQEGLTKHGQCLSWETSYFLPQFCPLRPPQALPWRVRAHQSQVRQLVGTLALLWPSVTCLSEPQFPHTTSWDGRSQGGGEVELKEG